MTNHSVIICSENNVDLKDKVIMGEQPSKVTPIFPLLDTKVTAEMTLGDLIKNAQIPSVSIVGFPTDVTIPVRNFCHISQVLGQEWVVPNIKIAEEIKNRNPNGYIYIESQSGDAKAILVLCEEIKDLYEDGSYKIRYNPVTHRTVKRMPE